MKSIDSKNMTGERERVVKFHDHELNEENNAFEYNGGVDAHIGDNDYEDGEHDVSKPLLVTVTVVEPELEPLA